MRGAGRAGSRSGEGVPGGGRLCWLHSRKEWHVCVRQAPEIMQHPHTFAYASHECTCLLICLSPTLHAPPLRDSRFYGEVFPPSGTQTAAVLDVSAESRGRYG